MAITLAKSRVPVGLVISRRKPSVFCESKLGCSSQLRSPSKASLQGIGVSKLYAPESPPSSSTSVVILGWADGVVIREPDKRTCARNFLGTRFLNLIKLMVLESLNSYQLPQPITPVCFDSEQASTRLFPPHPAPRNDDPQGTTRDVGEQLYSLRCKNLFPNL